MAVEGSRQAGGVLVGNRRLHGDHGREALPEQALRQAGGFGVARAAVAASQKDQRRQAAGLANGGGEIGGGSRERGAPRPQRGS